MDATIVEVSLVILSVGAVAAISFVVRAMHIQERGEERRHRERMDLWKQLAPVRTTGGGLDLRPDSAPASEGSTRAASFPEIADLPIPPSGPVSTRTPTQASPTQASPTRSEDEDQNDTVIFLGPLSQRGDAHRAVDGP